MKLFFFTVFFAIFVATFSFSQSFLAGFYLFATIFAIALIIYLIFLRSLNVFFPTIFFPLVIAFVISLASISTNYYLYNHFTVIPSQSEIKTTNYGYKYIISTGLILEQQSHNRYLRQSPGGIRYFLYSDKAHQAGDMIRLTARATVNNNSTLSLFSDNKRKNQEIPDKLSNFSFDFDSRQQMRGVAGSLWESNSITLDQEYLGFIPHIRFKIRSKISQTFDQGFTRGLIAGMTIGDRSLLLPYYYETFTDSGIVHIIAISGGHIVILVLSLNLLFFRLPFYIRTAIIIPIIIFYALICGLQASVFRASIMGILSLSAMILGRQTVVRRSLFIAFVSMLIINPLFLLYDIGFLFSFSAVIGIVYFSHLGSDLDLGKNKIAHLLEIIIKKYIIPSLGASIAITPFLLLFIGQFNIFSIIANIFVIPIVPFVMIGGIVSSLLGFIMPYFVIDIITYLTQYIYFIAQTTQSYGIYIHTQNQIYPLFLVFLVLIGFAMERYLSITKSSIK